MGHPDLSTMDSTQVNTGAEPPFTVRPLDKLPDDKNVRPSPGAFDSDFVRSLLPASYRTGGTSSDLTAASLDVAACIKKELALDRLHRIWKQIWMVGRPTPPRSLHHQLLLSRDIFLTEQMDMHLVWTTGRMFLKPVPRFLLEPRFWASYLASPEPCSCFRPIIDHKTASGNFKWATINTTGAESGNKGVKGCNGGLRMCALGFLFSYAALITHESDFEIAREKHLLPREVTWISWIALVRELDTANIYDSIDERFKYGELRLSRLNKIYFFTQCPWVMGVYKSHWDQYGTFLQHSFTWLASTTVYVIIVLTAMQVGLALDNLSDNYSFVSAAYGSIVIAIMGPLIAAGVIIMVFLICFVSNWVATLAFWRQRSSCVQLWTPITKQSRKATINASA